MTQIAIAAIAPQRPPPSLPADSSETGSFSPHLEQAIKNNNEQTTALPPEQGGKSGDPSKSTSGSGNSESFFEGFFELAHLTDNGNGIGQEVEELMVIGLHRQENATLDRGQTLVSLLNTPAATTPNSRVSPQLGQTIASVATLIGGDGQQVATAQPSQEHLALPTGQVATAQPSQERLALPTGSRQFVPPPAATTDDSNPLIQQLQRIIDSGQQDVTLSITTAGKTSRLSTSGGTITLRTETMPTAPIEIAVTLTQSDNEAVLPLGPGKLAVSPDQPQPPATLRQSMQQQYLESKISLETKQENDSGTGEKQRQQSPATAKTVLTGEAAASTSSIPTTETSSGFSQSLTNSLDGLKPLGHEISRPLLLPSGTLVHQEEVIRQIAEWFQISRRESDTRVNLRLHPAELGGLRIDLSVKNGTVRANVVASTQMAQDIIEKNMPRLRTILENQGFTIDEILVSNSSPSIDDFNLFDQHLFGHNDYTPSSSQQDAHPTVPFTLDGANPLQEPVTTGVNVKI